MPYYKVTLEDTPVDAVAVLDYCKYVERSRMVLRCSAKESPQGIISARQGTYYHVEGWPEFPAAVTGSGGTVQLTEIEQDIFEALVEALNTGSDLTPAPEPEEPEYPADATIEYVKAMKKEALNKACNETIVAGFSIPLSDGSIYTFDLSLEDQSNIMGLMFQVSAGATECDYYDTNGTCLTLTAADMVLLSNFATVYKSYHIAYYHCLCDWVDGLESIPEVAAVQYGAVVPEAYRNAYLLKYAAAIGVTDYETAE